MKNKKILLILALVFVLLMGGAYVLYNQLSADVDSDQLAQQEQSSTEDDSAEPEIIEAPDFTVYDAEGNEVQLSDYFGKPIVLNFWASWCGPCQMEMPDFNAACQELQGQVEFLMVNVTDGSRETVETALSFIEEKGYVFPVFYDTAYSATTAYGAYSLPTTYFIDAEGHIAARAVGAISAETLQQGIGLIM